MCFFFPAHADGASIFQKLPHFSFLEKQRIILDENDDFFLEDGRALKLAALDLPKLSSSEGGAKEQDFLDQRTIFLRLILENPHSLLISKKPDRWGRFWVHIFLEDGSWLQETLLLQGYARLLPQAEDRPVLKRLLSAEQTARQQKKGIWLFPRWALRFGQDMRRSLNRFAVVEGVIHDVRRQKSVVLLVLGSDPKQALTVKIENKIMRQTGFSPDDLRLRRILVRGWVGKAEGPLITLYGPDAIALLPP